jgi:hypothetical protein
MVVKYDMLKRIGIDNMMKYWVIEIKYSLIDSSVPK